jgi:alkanesulfonate monooxygenase SsuD/methylene tetrahydromethanopterin reductase-like flavin-dependent oxidoreductase (luciferase family)
MFGAQVMGTPEQMVDALARLSSPGVDGVVLSWVNYPGRAAAVDP